VGEPHRQRLHLERCMILSIRFIETALKIVARASRPLSRGHSFAPLRTGSARARERDAPATAGETPAPPPSTGGHFHGFWVPVSQQA